MPSKLQRLYVEAPLGRGGEIELASAQGHYLVNVLRLKPGDEVLLFNGRDGEWRAEIAKASKSGSLLVPIERSRQQTGLQDIHYLFSPLKRARLDYMAQKATELGVSVLQPAIMRHTVAERVNQDRLQANAVEAAEQCGLLAVPQVRPPRKLADILEAWDPARTLVFADEEAAQTDPVAALKGIPPGPLALLIGPEGGFHAEERARLLEMPCIAPISLGPRIMRADTAAVAALALVNSVLGDWR